jgi:hypothetical protein
VSIYCDINTLEVLEHLRSQRNTRLHLLNLQLLLFSTTPIVFMSQYIHVDMHSCLIVNRYSILLESSCSCVTSVSSCIRSLCSLLYSCLVITDSLFNRSLSFPSSCTLFRSVSTRFSMSFTLPNNEVCEFSKLLLNSRSWESSSFSWNKKYYSSFFLQIHQLIICIVFPGGRGRDWTRFGNTCRNMTLRVSNPDPV